MIHPKDREYAGVLTAILHAARLHAHESVRVRALLNGVPTMKLPPLPEITESAGIAALIINIVDRHMPPKERTPAKERRR